MEDKVITTPAGYKVTIKPGLTFAEKRQIQRVYADNTVFNPETEKYEVKGSAVYDDEDATLKFMVKQILDPNGSDITSANPLKVVLGWANEADAKAVYDAVNEADKASTLTDEQKKTRNSISSNSTATH